MTASNRRDDLTAALADLRSKADFPSLRTIGQAAGCSHTTVAKVFRSDAELVSLNTIHAICRALSCNVDEYERIRTIWEACKADLGPTPEPQEAILDRAISEKESESESRHSIPILVSAGFLLVLTIALAIGVSPTSVARNQAIVDFAQVLLAACATVTYAVRSYRFRGHPLAPSMLMAAAALGAWTVGQVTWTIDHLGSDAIPSLNFAAIGYLAMPVLMLPALWMRAKYMVAGNLSVSKAAAAVAVTGLAIFAVVHLAVSALPGAASVTGQEWISILFPITDAMLVAVALLPALRTQSGGQPVVIVVGLVALTASDLTFAIVRTGAADSLPPGTTLGFLVFLLAFLVSGLLPVAEAAGGSISRYQYRRVCRALMALAITTAFIFTLSALACPLVVPPFGVACVNALLVALAGLFGKWAGELTSSTAPRDR